MLSAIIPAKATTPAETRSNNQCLLILTKADNAQRTLQAIIRRNGIIFGESSKQNDPQNWQ